VLVQPAQAQEMQHFKQANVAVESIMAMWEGWKDFGAYEVLSNNFAIGLARNLLGKVA